MHAFEAALIEYGVSAMKCCQNEYIGAELLPVAALSPPSTPQCLRKPHVALVDVFAADPKCPTATFPHIVEFLPPRSPDGAMYLARSLLRDRCIPIEFVFQHMRAP